MRCTDEDRRIENYDNENDSGEIGTDVDGEGRGSAAVLPSITQLQQQHQQPQQTMDLHYDNRRLIRDPSISAQNVTIAPIDHPAPLANRISNNNDRLREPVLPSGELIDAKNTIGPCLEWGLTTAPSQFAMQGDRASIQNTAAIDGLSRMPTLGNNKLLRSTTLPSGEVIDAKNTVGVTPNTQQDSRRIDRLLHHTDEAPAGVDIGRWGGATDSSLTSEVNPTTIDTNSPSTDDALTTRIIIVNDTHPTRQDVHDPLLVMVEARFVRDGSTTEPPNATRAPEDTTASTNVSNATRTRPASRKSLRLILCVFVIAMIAAVAGVVGFLVCRGDGCSSSKESRPSVDSSRPIVSRIETAIPTSIPRMPPAASTVSQEHADQVISYINNITLSGQTFVGPNASRGTIMDEASEQALAWIIYEDPMRLLPETQSHQFQLVQRYALRTLIGQQSSPNQWSQSTWALSECDWFGIICTSMRTGNETGGERLVVTSIDFIGIILKGILPADIGLLSSLLYVDISLSNLLGTVPESIGNWKSITHLYLQENQLTGSLPSSIGNWHNITSLYLHKNELTGSIPSSVGNWHKIAHLDFGYNSFTGPLPYSIGSWPNLLIASMKHNSLMGAIPSSIGNWTSVTLVDLSFNSLSGILPSSIGNWKFVGYVDISENQLRGTFPSSIGNNWTNVTDIYLNANMFTGVVPTDWCELTSLNLLWADCIAEVTCTCCTECK